MGVVSGPPLHFLANYVLAMTAKFYVLTLTNQMRRSRTRARAFSHVLENRLQFKMKFESDLSTLPVAHVSVILPS